MFRLIFLVLFATAAIYLIAAIHSREARRKKLEQEWNDLGRHGDMHAFVREGMADYQGSFRRRLLLAIFAVPILGIGLIIYFVN